MTKIAFFGEAMLEIAANGKRHFGGDTANTAVYLARLLVQHEQYQVMFASAIGYDVESDWLKLNLEQEGVDTRLMTRSNDKNTGRYQINVSPQGERSFAYDRADSAAKYYLASPNCPLIQAIQNDELDYLYLSGISLAILSDQDRQLLFSIIEQGKQKKLTVIFDNNYRPILWQYDKEKAASVYQTMMSLADIALVTDDDDFALFGEPVASPQTGQDHDDNTNTTYSIVERWQVPELVIKRGSRYAANVIDQMITKQPAEQGIAAVDTSAAGDSFAAGYLAAHFTGQDARNKLQLGHQLAAIVIQHDGAIIAPEHMHHLVHRCDTQYQQNNTVNAPVPTEVSP